MEQILHTLHEFVWSPGMLAFFLLTGIYFTVQSKFYSILRIKETQKKYRQFRSFSLFVQHWQQRLVQEISQGLQLR